MIIFQLCPYPQKIHTVFSFFHTLDYLYMPVSYFTEFRSIGKDFAISQTFNQGIQETVKCEVCFLSFYLLTDLNDLSDQGTFTPVSAQGGVPWNPPEKTTFPPEFCNEICTIYVRVIKNHNSAKKKLKCCTVSKWRPNNRFLFRVISILAKF